MSVNLHLINENEPTPKGARPNPANNGRVAGNAVWNVARRPSYPYRLMKCTFCHQDIQPGTLYVRQTRWLRDRKGRWFPKGPRHDRCWGLENDYVK